MVRTYLIATWVVNSRVSDALLAGLVGIAISVAACSPSVVHARQNTFIAKFKDWEVHRGRVGAATVCYAATLPKKRSGKYTRRGETSLIVSFWPSQKISGQVEIRAGYTYKPESAVMLEFNNGTKFRLKTEGDTAWGVDASDDNKIVNNLSNRVWLRVYGQSSRGTRTTDSYSLSGFRDAFKRARVACGMK